VNVVNGFRIRRGAKNRGSLRQRALGFIQPVFFNVQRAETSPYNACIHRMIAAGFPPGANRYQVFGFGLRPLAFILQKRCGQSVHQSAIFGPNRSDTLHSFEGFPRLCLPAQLELGCRKNLKRTQQQLILRWVNPQKCINGSLGISGGYWFEGMGCFAAVRRQPIFSTPVKTTGPDSPVVLTVKVLFCHLGLPIQEQGNRGRAELLSTPFRQYELKLREQLTDMFGGSGFDARRDIAGIILNRWGHAYCSPQPGFFFGKDGRPAPRDVLRNASFGRIAFANTDLSGDPSHETSINEAERAAGQLLDGALAA